MSVSDEPHNASSPIPELEAARARWDSKIHQAVRSRTPPHTVARVPQPLNLGAMSNVAGFTAHAERQYVVGNVSVGGTYLTPPATAQRFWYREGVSSTLSTPLSSTFSSPDRAGVQSATFTPGCVDPTIDPSTLAGAPSPAIATFPRHNGTENGHSRFVELERLSFSEYVDDDAWDASDDDIRGDSPSQPGLRNFEDDLDLVFTLKQEPEEPDSSVDDDDTPRASVLNSGLDASPVFLETTPDKHIKKRSSRSLDAVAIGLQTKRNRTSTPQRLSHAASAPPSPPGSSIAPQTIPVVKSEAPPTPVDMPDFPSSPTPTEANATPSRAQSPASDVSAMHHSDAESEYFPEPPASRTRAATRRAGRMSRISSSPELRPISPEMAARATPSLHTGSRRMSQNRSAQKKYRDKNRRLLDLVRDGRLSPSAGMARLAQASDEFSRNVKCVCAMTWARYDDQVQARRYA